jgi:hypothetical protein
LIIKTNPDKIKVQSILKMVDKTLLMINSIDYNVFPSNVLQQYYDVLRELMTIIMLLDGFKTKGEGAHKEIIEYIGKNYSSVTQGQIMFLDELRVLRNRISYDGFFIESDFVIRKNEDIIELVRLFKEIIDKKM